MYVITGFENNLYKVLDTSDGVTEFHTLSRVKNYAQSVKIGGVVSTKSGFKVMCKSPDVLDEVSDKLETIVAKVLMFNNWEDVSKELRVRFFELLHLYGLAESEESILYNNGSIYLRDLRWFIIFDKNNKVVFHGVPDIRKGYPVELANLHGFVYYYITYTQGDFTTIIENLLTSCAYLYEMYLSNVKCCFYAPDTDVFYVLFNNGLLADYKWGRISQVDIQFKYKHVRYYSGFQNSHIDSPCIVSSNILDRSCRSIESIRSREKNLNLILQY